MLTLDAVMRASQNNVECKPILHSYEAIRYISLDSVYYLCFYRNLICVEMEMMA